MDGPRGRIYIRSLRLQPVTVNVTVELAALTDEPDLQRYHPTRRLVGIAQNLAFLQAATINMDQIFLEEVQCGRS